MKEDLLVAQAKAGSNSAFTLLWEGAEKKVRGYIASLGAAQGDLGDFVQDTALAAWRNIRSFQGGSSFTTWACVIARNHFYNALRTRIRRKLVSLTDIKEPPSPCMESVVNRNVDEKRIWSACRQLLSDRELSLFTSFYVEGCKLGELGGDLNLSSASPRVIVFRARRRLIKHLSLIHI
jgi:RNA polymerase sigma factor (sigma-70 family)